MLKKGDKAPDFTLSETSGVDVSLSEYKGKWLILYFYPKDNTPGCTKQAIDFSEMLPEFQELGIDIIGINGDSIESHQTFCKRNNLNIKLLSDPKKTVLQTYKVWGEKRFMGQLYEGLTRTTFIINPEGIIEEALYNVKASGHVARVLKLVKNLLGSNL